MTRAPLRGTVTIDFVTQGSAGPAALTGGTAHVFKEGSTTPTSTGVTLSTDVDSRTGLNRVTINTATDDTFFDREPLMCSVVVEGTIDGESGRREKVGGFQLRGIAGIVVADAGNTALAFKVDLPDLGDDQYNRAFVKFTGGALLGQVAKITDCVAATGFLTVEDGFTAAPTAADPFEIVNG